MYGVNRSETPWMRPVLVAAAVYHLLWGALGVLFPGRPFEWLGIESPLDPMDQQSLGLTMACFGIGFAAAALRPLQHWPVVFIALARKVLGPVVFLGAALEGSVPWVAGAVILFDDLIWIAPFALIVRTAYRDHVAERDRPRPLPRDRAILKHMSQRGYTLAELSELRLTLTLFLRHTGCAFCREALDDIRMIREELETQGVGLAFVHMTPEPEAEEFFARFGLADIDRFADLDCELYRAFGLPRVGLGELFAPSGWLRGLRVAVLGGHGLGGPAGDALRMPGMFLMDNGLVAGAYLYSGPAERPDYLEFVRSPSSGLPGGTGYQAPARRVLAEPRIAS